MNPPPAPSGIVMAAPVPFPVRVPMTSLEHLPDLQEVVRITESRHYLWQEWRAFSMEDVSMMVQMLEQLRASDGLTVVSAIGSSFRRRSQRLALALAALTCYREQFELPDTPLELRHVIARSDIYASECRIDADESTSQGNTMDWYVHVVESGALMVLVDNTPPDESESQAEAMVQRIVHRIRGVRAKRSIDVVESEFDAFPFAGERGLPCEPLRQRARMAARRADKRTACELSMISLSV